MASIRELIKKQQNKFATNLEDRRQLRGLAKRQAAQEAALNAKPAPIPQTTPADVELPQAKPAAGAVTLRSNPEFNVDTQGQVTRGPRGNFQSQAQRNAAKQAQGGQTVTVQPDRPSLRQPVEATRGGVGPAAGTTETFHVGQDGSTLSDEDLKAQNRQRAQANARAQAQEVLQNTKKYSAAQVKAASEFLASGAATEAVGEVAGRNTAGLNKGFQQGLDDVAAIEAEAPLPPRDVPNEDVVLKGPQERPDLRQAAVDPPPAAPEAPEAPRQSRTVLGKAVDGVKNIPDRLLNKTNTPTAAPAGPGRMRRGVNLGGKIVGSLALPEIASTIAQSAQDGTLQEDAEAILASAPEALGNFVENLVKDPVGMAKEIGQDAVNAVLNLPGDMIAGLGAFNEITSGRNGVIPASGITGAPEQSVFDVVREQFPTFDLFGDGSQSGPPTANGDPAQSSPPPASTGLRQSASVDPSQGSYFINNGAGSSGFEGLAGGTGGEAQGQKQFFSDLPQAFPQQERGLGAARNEISGRGRFSDDPLANLAGEFAQSRTQSDKAKLDSFDARTNTLRGNAASVTSAASRAANEKRFKEIDDNLNSGDETTIRNTMSGVFGRFQNMINQGVYDPNNADVMQASNIITRSAVDATDIGLAKGVWNSLMPAFLAGGGMGALQFLNGELSINGSVPYEGLQFDDDGTLMAKSSDPAAGWINLGYIDDPDTANFLRQILSVHDSKGQ